MERNCTGMEANLNDCPYVGSTDETCAASDNVYVVCQGKTMYTKAIIIITPVSALYVQIGRVL